MNWRDENNKPSIIPESYWRSNNKVIELMNSDHDFYFS